MNTKLRLLTTCLLATALMAPVAGYTAESVKTAVKDSVITTKIKAKLAEEKLSSAARISVDTDNKGMVTLSGRARSQEEADKAVSIARGVEGVVSVENKMRIVPDK